MSCFTVHVGARVGADDEWGEETVVVSDNNKKPTKPKPLTSSWTAFVEHVPLDSAHATFRTTRAKRNIKDIVVDLTGEARSQKESRSVDLSRFIPQGKVNPKPPHFNNSGGGDCAFFSMAQIWYPYDSVDNKELYKKNVIPAAARLRLAISVAAADAAECDTEAHPRWKFLLQDKLRILGDVDDKGRAHSFSLQQYAEHVRKPKQWAIDNVFAWLSDLAPVDVVLLNLAGEGDPNIEGVYQHHRPGEPPRPRFRVVGDGQHYELCRNEKGVTVKDFDAVMIDIEQQLTLQKHKKTLEAHRNKSRRKDAAGSSRDVIDLFAGDMDDIDMPYESTDVYFESDKDKIGPTMVQMKCMQPGEELNESVINYYMKLLDDRELRSTGGRGPQCAFWDSFAYLKMTGKTFRAARNYPVRSLIFIPMHVNGNHWVMVEVDTVHWCLRFFDSMGGSHGRDRMLIVSAAISREYPALSGKEWALYIMRDIPQQNNIVDCGVFMLRFIKLKSKRQEITFTQQNVGTIRRNMVTELEQGFINMPV